MSIAECAVLETQAATPIRNGASQTSYKISVQGSGLSTQSKWLEGAVKSMSEASSSAESCLVFYFPDRADEEKIASDVASFPLNSILAIGNFDDKNDAQAFAQSTKIVRPDLVVVDIRISPTSTSSCLTVSSLSPCPSPANIFSFLQVQPTCMI